MMPDGLGEMTLPHARRPQQEHVAVAADDFAGGQVENLFPANRPVEVPVEVFQRFLFSEAGRASAAGDQSLVSHRQFVLVTGLTREPSASAASWTRDRVSISA